LISDKISTALLFVPEILLHVSRPVRWDSDHVVIFDDELRAIATEILRTGEESRVHIGLDYFDASINRVAAWVIGTRNMQKALLYAALEPSAMLRDYEVSGDFTFRLALMEEMKTFPFTEVWCHYCEEQNVPSDGEWLGVVKAHEKKILSER
ncbi:MAG: L-rhamnose isomerase, partial [Firmicutes bacterium]|nr:L-rhamnose isomerase [Bacillota bacterium]